MRYWWVNQNQTFRHEFAGGYLWSPPKRNTGGRRNPFYDSMREVSPGDLAFGFADTRIRTFGIATSYAYENPKPGEFGNVGRNWEQVGWRVDVQWQQVPTVVRPVEVDGATAAAPARQVLAAAARRPRPSGHLSHRAPRAVRAPARASRRQRCRGDRTGETVADVLPSNAESLHPELALWE